MERFSTSLPESGNAVHQGTAGCPGVFGEAAQARTQLAEAVRACSDAREQAALARLLSYSERIHRQSESAKPLPHIRTA